MDHILSSFMGLWPDIQLIHRNRQHYYIVRDNSHITHYYAVWEYTVYCPAVRLVTGLNEDLGL